MTGKRDRLRSGGVISDLDGTLYKNAALQREFEAAYTDFVAEHLSISGADAGAVLRRVRAHLTRTPTQPPGELRMLEELGLRTADWFAYSSTRVVPERYLSRDPELEATLRSARTVLWFDVATNTAPGLANRILSCIGISDSVDGLWTATEERSAGKPAPELYRQIIDHRGLVPSRVLVIGDRWHVDLVGVEELGMEGCLVVNSVEAREKIREFAERAASCHNPSS